MPTSQERQPTWQIRHTLSLMLILGVVFLLEVFLPPQLNLLRWSSILALLAVFAVIAGHGVTGRWLGLLIDSNNQVSLSRLQMVLWTVMILSGFLAAVLANIEAGHPEPLAITIPAELWLLMGISTTSLVSAPLILQARKRQPVTDAERETTLHHLARQAVDLSRVAIHGRVVVNATPAAAQWSDLFQGWETGSAGRLDLGKVQMFFFTVILVLAYGAALAALFGSSTDKISTLPALDAGTLALLGISHAGYLASQALPGSAHKL